MTITGSQREILATAKGGGFLAGGNMFEWVSRFVIALILARTLGSNDYGLLNLAISAGALVTGLSSLGLDDAMTRYIAVQDARGDVKGMYGTLQVGLGVSLLTAIVAGTALFFAAEPVATGIFDEPRLESLLRLMAVLIPVLSLSRCLVGSIRGLKRMDYAAFSENVVQSVAKVVLLLVMSLVGLDVWVAAVVFGIGDIASSVTMTILLNRAVRLAGLREAHAARREPRALMRFALPLWISGVLNQFRRQIETLLIGALSVASNVGIFGVVDRLTVFSHMFYRSIIVAVKPTLAGLHDKGDRQALSDVYVAATRWTLFFNLPFFLMMVLYPKALLAIFGSDFVVGADALVVLAFGELVIAATGVCGSMIDMTGHLRLKVFNSVVWVLTLAGLNAWLIPRHGLIGAAVASLIGSTVVNGLRVGEIWYLEGLRPWGAGYWKPVLGGLGAGLLGVLLGDRFPVGTSLLKALPQGAAVLVVYIGLLLVFGMEEEDRLIYRRLRRRLPGPLRSGGTPKKKAGR